MCYDEGMNKLVVGGNNSLQEVSLDKMTVSHTVQVASVPRAVDTYNGKLILGMLNGTIQEIDYATLFGGGVPRWQEVMHSHNKGEVWGLDVIEGQVFTTGDDNQLICWDPKKHCSVSRHIIDDVAGKKEKYGASTLSDLPDNQCSRAVAKAPNQERIAVATNAGPVQIRDMFGKVVCTLKEPNRWIECLEFSPDSSKLAVGSHDTNIYIYDATNWTLLGKLDKNNASITHVDWTEDSKYIRCIDGAYEILFYDIETMQQDGSGATATKDMDWHNHSLQMGWCVTGVIPAGMDGTHVNGVNLSNDKETLATGCDWGMVTLYRFPARDGAKGTAYG